MMSDFRLQSIVEQETQQAISVINQMASALRSCKIIGLDRYIFDTMLVGDALLAAEPYLNKVVKDD